MDSVIVLPFSGRRLGCRLVVYDVGLGEQQE
jgi:hypothetical protein